jgi:hypothetical protein
VPALVPGTKHFKTLHRDEPAILGRVECLPLVKKLKSSIIENTNSSAVKLQLRPHPLAGKIESIVGGWLYIGGGKRKLTIYTTANVTIETLRDELAVALADYHVPIEVFESKSNQMGENTMAIGMQPDNHVQSSAPDKDHLLAICDLIADSVLRARSRLPEQNRLRAELDAVTAEIEQAHNDAISLLAQVYPELPPAL